MLSFLLREPLWPMITFLVFCADRDTIRRLLPVLSMNRMSGATAAILGLRGNKHGKAE